MTVFSISVQSIGDRLESFEVKASDVFKRSETLTHEQCTNEKEYDAVKRAVSKLRLDWNNVNKVQSTVFLLQIGLTFMMNTSSRHCNIAR